MTTDVQMIDRGGLVKLFGATIHVAPPPAGASNPPLPCRTEHKAAPQLLHNDKKPKTNDDARKTEQRQTTDAKFIKRQVDPASQEEEEEEGEEEEQGVETEEKQQQQQQNDKADLTKKKPDKLLPCPRCDSLDTKFCYYNNYNVNQPRHFCRECQRYWTAGGAVRPNMPVGAGRRKKPSRGATARCPHKDGDVVVVLDSVTDHGDACGDRAILSFADGGLPSPPTRQRHLPSPAQPMSMLENCPIIPPQLPCLLKDFPGNPPLYLYRGNPPPPPPVCGITTPTGFIPSPHPVPFCWTPNPAAAGWHVFSVVPWAPYHPTQPAAPPIPAPVAVNSHDADRLSFASSVVDDTLSRQSSSSHHDTTPSPKPAAKKRSSAIIDDEEAKPVRTCQSYHLTTDISAHRTELVSKVLQSNPAAMMRSLNFQETV